MRTNLSEKLLAKLRKNKPNKKQRFEQLISSNLCLWKTLKLLRCHVVMHVGSNTTLHLVFLFFRSIIGIGFCNLNFSGEHIFLGCVKIFWDK